MSKSITILLLAVFLLSLPGQSFAQFKRDTNSPNISGVLSPASPASILGFFDPSKMTMHHSFSMSYGAMGSNGMALSTYMNTIDYRFSENLLFRANLGLMTSPYNTFGEDFYLNKPKFFGGAELHYKFSDNASLHFQFESSPYTYNYYNNYNYYRPVFSDFDN